MRRIGFGRQDGRLRVASCTMHGDGAFAGHLRSLAPDAASLAGGPRLVGGRPASPRRDLFGARRARWSRPARDADPRLHGRRPIAGHHAGLAQAQRLPPDALGDRAQHAVVDGAGRAHRQTHPRRGAAREEGDCDRPEPGRNARCGAGAEVPTTGGAGYRAGQPDRGLDGRTPGHHAGRARGARRARAQPRAMGHRRRVRPPGATEAQGAGDDALLAHRWFRTLGGLRPRRRRGGRGGRQPHRHERQPARLPGDRAGAPGELTRAAGAAFWLSVLAASTLAGCSSEAGTAGSSPSTNPTPTSSPAAASPTAAVTASPAPAPAASVCPDPTEHVYHPYRLQLRNRCLTVTGSVFAVRSEPDGDYHILLQLDAPYANLINTANVSREHSALALLPLP